MYTGVPLRRHGHCGRYVGSTGRIGAALLSCLALLSAARYCAGDERSALADVRFQIARGVDCVLVPIFIGSDRRLFIVDTACAVTLVDESLRGRLGKPLGSGMFAPAAGPKELQLFEAPRATLAGRRLTGVSMVCCADLSNVRTVSGCEIYGILGMDFLRQQIVRMDFDAGHLDFLRSAPRDAGAAVPLVYSREFPPAVRFKVEGVGDAWFIIDTADVGFDAGSVEPRLFQYLVDTGWGSRSGIAGLVASLEETRSGAPFVRLGATELGGCRHRGLSFTRGSNNSLGIGYLSRFTVVFDFPARRMYLKRGKRFDEPSHLNRAGIDLCRVDGHTRVEVVDEDSAGEAAGLRPGDLIHAIDSVEVDSLSIFKIMEQLNRDGGHALSIQRGSVRLGSVLRVPKKDLDFPKPATGTRLRAINADRPATESN